MALPRNSKLLVSIFHFQKHLVFWIYKNALYNRCEPHERIRAATRGKDLN